MTQKIILIVTIILMTGCASTYRHAELQAPTTKLDPNKGVLISKPEDGRYENIHYNNSGLMTANAIRAVFAKNAKRTAIAQNCKEDVCLNSIDLEKYGYFVKPTILHWEDRATEWSGKPDRIEIQIVIYDAMTKEELANSSYIGKSKWVTFGGDHPQDLLPEPTSEYVSKLYK